MGTGHEHSARASSRGRLKKVLLLTSAYLIAEVIGGLVTGSLALLADAGHMLTDVGGVGLALLALTLSDRKATPARSYGLYRAEILAAFANCLALIGIAAYVLYEAYQRFREPPPISSGLMLAVASVGLVINIGGVMLLRGDASTSLNMKGAYFEVLSDLLSSVAVIVAAIVMWATGWYYADPILSVGIGLFVLPRTWILLREAIDVLLEATPKDVDIAALREVIGAVVGVVSLHDLHVWSLTTGINAMSVHIVKLTSSDHDAVLSAVHAAVTPRFKIHHLTAQVESGGCRTNSDHA